MNPSPEKFFYSGTRKEITEHAAAFIIAEAYRAVADHGRFSLVLAGGNSPRPLYRHLAQGVSIELLQHYELKVPDCDLKSNGKILSLPENTWLFQGDERCVPSDHPDSNFRMVHETLLLQSGIPENHFFRMPTDKANTEKGAREYEATIRNFFLASTPIDEQEFPLFDLIVLGLGDDGHTASLFAGNTEALQEKTKWVVAVSAPEAKPPGKRLTLTLPAINHARNVMFFTTGAPKAELAKKIFLEETGPLPAALVSPVNGKLFWFSDHQ